MIAYPYHYLCPVIVLPDRSRYLITVTFSDNIDLSLTITGMCGFKVIIYLLSDFVSFSGLPILLVIMSVFLSVY